LKYKKLIKLRLLKFIAKKYPGTIRIFLGQWSILDIRIYGLEKIFNNINASIHYVKK